MKKILFVDDEPKLLQGLQRMLRSMRHEWDMAFASGGREALELLEQAPYDVIVTDMRMPGMDGVQLLKEVVERFPMLVRIILSGQTDQEAFLSSSSIVHQFLSKPCDTELLKTTIERACALQNLLKDESLKKLVLQIESLPSQSSLYTEIKEALQSPNISMGKIGQIIARDIGMTAKTIQLVNSAFYGLRRRISSPTEATVILGVNTIKALVLSHNIFSNFNHVIFPGFSPDALWKHSSVAGLFAREIAKAENYKPEMIEDALVAGMLHDLGKLVLVANLPAPYNKAQALARGKIMPLCEAEQEVLGGTHAEVGAYLIGLWGITNSIVEALAFHHNPDRCAAKTFTLVTAVHVADVLANEVYPVETGVEVKVDSDYLAKAGMTERLPVWRERCLALYRQ
ncbi:MAG: response regulator [Planctomycetota bacterium]